MTNDIHNDPRVAEFVTKVIDMAPEAPVYPEQVVAAPGPVRRKVAPWVWAPVTAAAVMLVVAPIALRGGSGDETADLPFGSEQTVTETAASDASTDPIVGPGPVVPSIEEGRNLLSISPVVAAPGGSIVIDFSGEDNNTARSDLFWMDRFDHAEQQWFAEWILWSDRADGGASFAPAASTSVIVPPLSITEEGDDTLLLPSDLPLGTYRVCIGVTNGACGVFEVSDELVPSSDPVVTPTDDPLEVVVDPIRPAFGRVELDPSSLMLAVTPAQWLTGPDAVIVAREDGFIGPDEDLPNPFYIRLNPEVGELEFEIVPEVQLFLVGVDDPSIQQVLTIDEWVAMATGRTDGMVDGIFVNLTYDADGRVLTVTQKYIP